MYRWRHQSRIFWIAPRISQWSFIILINFIPGKFDLIISAQLYYNVVNMVEQLSIQDQSQNRKGVTSGGTEGYSSCQLSIYIYIYIYALQ